MQQLQSGIFKVSTRFGWGHCIGVDPYYLAQKFKNWLSSGIILSGRRLNDSMGYYVADQVIKLLVKHNIKTDIGNINFRFYIQGKLS